MTNGVERNCNTRTTKMNQITSQRIKIAKTKPLYVGFAEVRDGQVVYRDGVRADSVKDAIAVRFAGSLPVGFIVERVVR